MKSKTNKVGLESLLKWAQQFSPDARIEGGRVVVDGNLDCSNKGLKSLHDFIGWMSVGRGFYCYNNQLTSIPDSIGGMKIKGNFWCHNNQLTSLPDSIGGMKVGGDFYCVSNQLTSLPDSIGWMKVGGSFNCSFNQLASLPNSIGEIKIGRNFYCSYNKLASLPESVGKMKVGGCFDCSDNQLTSLPDSIGKMKVGGDFYCYNNPLTAIPKVGKLKKGIFQKEGYVYLDGILGEIISIKKISDGKTVIKTPFYYVVSDGENHAHGKNSRDAFLDLHFKTSKKDLEKYRSLDLDKKRDLNEIYEIYRNVTGACSFGVGDWMGKNPDFIHKIEKEGASIRDVISATAGAYGNDKMREFFS